MPFQLAMLRRFMGVATVFAAAVWRLEAAESGTEERLARLAEQNARLQTQVAEQQKLIEQLAAEIAEIRGKSVRQERALEDLQERVEEPVAPVRTVARDATVRIGGEAGIAFFHTSATGQFPNSEFRVDDAKVTVEARVRENVYAWVEFNLLTRETNSEAFTLGELYVDFENVVANGAVNLRAGRLNIPFGEEYQVRGVIANPLISHSLSDLWGVDEGVEIYGAVGDFSYVAAVQNGGHSLLNDDTADKAVTVRVGYDPRRWLHLSASVMRTGDLPTTGDMLSELWFGNGFFRPIGASGSTSTFAAELFQLDAKVRWRSGHVSAAAGWARYDDDDTTGDNARRMNFQTLEGVQHLGERLYGAIRYSAIDAPRGYPLVG